eukprot:gene1137-1443_t
MKFVDRGLFIPNVTTDKYADEPKPIGYGATISAPHMHAIQLEFLAQHLKPGCRALDIGSGSGYIAACMADLTGPTGRVVGIEHIPQLVEQSKRNINQLDPSLMNRISIMEGDGAKGYREGGPYDAIHVGASAPREIPQELINQLKIGGRLVIPVESSIYDELLIVDKGQDSKITVTSGGSVKFVPLTTKDKQLGDAGY